MHTFLATEITKSMFWKHTFRAFWLKSMFCKHTVCAFLAGRCVLKTYLLWVLAEKYVLKTYFLCLFGGKVCFENILFVHFDWKVCFQNIHFERFLTEKYVFKTYSLRIFGWKVCFENILFVISIAQKVCSRYLLKSIWSLLLFMHTNVQLVIPYYLCLSRPHILGTFLARFDSVLSAKRLPVPLPSTRFRTPPTSHKCNRLSLTESKYVMQSILNTLFGYWRPKPYSKTQTILDASKLQQSSGLENESKIRTRVRLESVDSSPWTRSLDSTGAAVSNGLESGVWTRVGSGSMDSVSGRVWLDSSRIRVHSSRTRVHTPDSLGPTNFNF